MVFLPASINIVHVRDNVTIEQESRSILDATKTLTFCILRFLNQISFYVAPCYGITREKRSSKKIKHLEIEFQIKIEKYKYVYKN